MIDSNALNPGQTCPIKGCNQEIVSVSHRQVPDRDELADGICWLPNDDIKTEGIVTLSGNTTVIFHEPPSMEGANE